MQETAIREGAPEPGIAATPMASAPSALKRRRGPFYRALELVASLRITVVLFILAFLLVFFGTWAQVDYGTWTATYSYFRGWGFVRIPLKIILMRAYDIPEAVAIPFPRGYTLGALLLVNLLAAHSIRFKLSWKRSGILMLHFGLILMMVGEFITGEFANEGRMPIVEGYAADHVDSDRQMEFAVVEPKAAEDVEIRVPASLLANGSVIQHADLPFDIEVVRFLPNSDFRPAQGADKNPATAGVGARLVAVEKGEGAGTDPNQTVDIPSAYLKFKKKGTGEDLGTYLVSSYFCLLRAPADTVTVDAKSYSISLRPKRTYRTYTIQLKKFDHDVYPGTDMPRNFSSEVHLADPGLQEKRDVKIWMNHPLRYHGETFYQAGWLSVTKGTILQVVRNPGWLLPYFSCGLVALGMIIHFGIHLAGFLRRKLA